MGCKPSSLPWPALTIKSSRARLRKKVSPLVARNPCCSIPHQGSSSWRQNRSRWIKGIRPTTPEDSVRSIPGFWHFSNRSDQSIEKDLRVVNRSRPQTPMSIDRSGKYSKQLRLDDTNIVYADVDSPASKESSTGLTEKPQIAAMMPKPFKIEIKPANAIIGVTGDLAASSQRKSMEQDEQRKILRHLEEARFLTDSLRSLQRYKSRIGEHSLPVKIE